MTVFATGPSSTNPGEIWYSCGRHCARRLPFWVGDACIGAAGVFVGAGAATADEGAMTQREIKVSRLLHCYSITRIKVPTHRRIASLITVHSNATRSLTSVWIHLFPMVRTSIVYIPQL